MEDPKLEQLLALNGFEKYVPNFRAHAIRSDVLLNLTSEDLVEIGVSSLGHRIQLLKLVDSQRQSSPGLDQLPSSASTTTLNTLISAPHTSFASAALGPSGISSAANTSSSSLVSNLFSPLSPESGASTREVQVLKQRLEVSEKHIRKLGEQVARLRADLFRKFKESEPLPTPTGRSLSPGSTPAFIGKRTPSDGYFSRAHVSALQSSNVKPSSVPNTGISSHMHQNPYGSSHGNLSASSPGGARSTVHVFHGHLQPSSTTSNFPPGTTHTFSPTASNQSSNSPHAPDNANLVITAPSEPFKNFRCGEKDNVSKVLTALFQQKYLEGDISQWRLRIEYGDKARELLDHEFPLVVFKQLQDQGHSPVFTMKAAQPHKPPAGSYI